MAKNHERSVYFSTNAILASGPLGHAWKLCTDMNLVPLMPDEDETFSGSLVLDLRIWSRHVLTLYRGRLNFLLLALRDIKMAFPRV